jgi:hypothetical protein
MAEVQKDTLGSREDTLRFLDMVGLLGSQAMMGLGKIANPMTHKAEKNLPVARLFIDTLEMLEHKTQGNLTPDEAKVLQATLTDLRMMFVEESKNPANTESPPPGEPAKPEAETDESKVKFHKKYE